MQPINFPVPEIDFTPLLPMMVVVITGILALLLQMFHRSKDNSMVALLSVLGLVISGVLLALQMTHLRYEVASGMIYSDPFGRQMQLLIVIGTALTILFSEGYLSAKRISFAEFYPLVLWSAFGGMLMAGSQNLLIIFLGLEVLSVSLYVMAGMSRSEEKSEESAMKYFLLGSFASAFLLYGIALIYGATNTLNVSMMSWAWSHGDATIHGLLLFGLGMALIGLSFKASFVPFHQWTPDVYQGAPTNVTAYMATCSKVGAIAALWRVLDGASIMREQWFPALAVVAVLTMTVGNVVALTQKDVKRILGYSSIAHAGYLLVAILAHFNAPDKVSSTTVIFYLFSYMLMTIGAFAVVSMTARNGREVTRVSDLNGLYKRNPFAAVCLIFFVASLIGIPLTTGFFGKFMIFGDALTAGLGWLAIVLAVNSVISLFYYLSLAKAAFVTEDEDIVHGPMNPGLAIACVLCVIGVTFGSAAITMLSQIH